MSKDFCVLNASDQSSIVAAAGASDLSFCGSIPMSGGLAICQSEARHHRLLHSLNQASEVKCESIFLARKPDSFLLAGNPGTPRPAISERDILLGRVVRIASIPVRQPLAKAIVMAWALMLELERTPAATVPR